MFVEPASAAGVAGLLAKHERGEVESGQRIVITLTGNGLKDVDTALSSRTPLRSPVVGARLADVAHACGFGS